MPIDRPARARVEAGTVWGPTVGYSRATRVGERVVVAGTTGLGPDGRVVPGGMEAQARQALRNIVAALEQLGARPADVVRTRIFVTDISQWEAAGRAHGEVFADIRPASTMVEVRRLIDPEMLVEIEAEAIVVGER
ncbi:MAG TPA: RidA family protein [Gemmatimonadales bacterium]|nr:RidA family protein [Gemmatimonadales bacterium]